jgi:carbon storage regulator
MLVFGRKEGQCVRIGKDIEVTILEVQGGRVKLGFTGPAQVPIHRGEVSQRIARWPSAIPVR